ncbi:unnamed protein product [Durusdinium trenchii]|uniref:Dynamin N-terminal domain-containing protein n=1 Tax=Durusdinium trenchii TaxID=1381693 RepID=A0ABP0K3Z6_9DINO
MARSGASHGLKAPALLNAYSALKTVQEMDPDFKHKVRVPVMVITGTQSAGKTTFIEAMVGFPVGFTDRNTGTRCPVRYVLRRSEEACYKVAGQELRGQKEVREKVTAQMKNLELRKQFISEEGTVFSFGEAQFGAAIGAKRKSESEDRVGEGIVKWIIERLLRRRRGETARERMSMARMQDRSQPDSEDIAKIVKEYLRNDRVMPVVLCKARSGIDVDFDVADGEFKN